MTDNEIIKALECCNRNGSCSKCPYDRVRFEAEQDCASEMTADALDLINRLKVEIERLHSILLSFTNEVSTWSNRKGYDTTELSLIPILNESKSILTDIKAEAVKEFAERLLDKYEVWTDSDEREFQYVVELVEELKKELIGD